MAIVLSETSRASRRGAKSNKLKLIAQGAESKLFVKDDLLIKKRLKKDYRISQIDLRLRKRRTKSEAKMLKRASKLISVPKVRQVSEFEIVMDYLDAPVLRDVFQIISDEILSQVGKSIALLHQNHLIHGDLTTSNMILKNDEVFLIDFGLGEVKDSFESKAVDLHLLKQGLKSKHYKEYNHAWKIIKESYVKHYVKGDQVIDRLKVVERRGRYKKKK